MKHPLWTRSVSLLMAVLMMLSISIPAAAVDVEQSAENTTEAAADTGNSAVVDTAEDPFDNSGDTAVSGDAEEETSPEQQDAVTAEETTGQEEAPVYVNEDGKYAAPETLTAYITAYVDDTEADGSEAEESYTGVVAFYDYNETDQEKMLEQPYFFYYEKGELQDLSVDPDAEERYILSDHYLALTSAPEQETDENGTERLAYVGQEVYVDQDAEEHPEYLFAFNLSDVENGLYSGSNDGVAYVDGLSDSVALVLTQNETTGGSPTLTWTAVTGAKSYNVYRTTGSSWGTAIASGVTGTTYTDSGALNEGTTYSYQVRAVYSDGSQSADGVSVVNYTCHAAPKTAVAATYEGIQVTWSRDADAAGYRVLRKAQKDKDWTAVSDVDNESKGSQIQWVDTAASSDGTYTYAVRAYYGTKNGDAREAYTDNAWSGISASESVYYLAAPELTRVYSISVGMSLTWSKVDGAASYQVWRKGTTENQWHLMYTTEDASTLKYVDTAAKAGNSYFYRVRAVNTDGVRSETYEYSRDITNAYAYHGTPSVTAKSRAGIEVTWTKDVDATGYRVFRKVYGTNLWKAIADITSGNTHSYVDKSVSVSTKYCYCVRSYYGTASDMAKDTVYNSNLWSGYTSCSAVTYTGEAPVLGATYSEANGLRTTWTPVSGAIGYIVYRRSASSSTYREIARVTGNASKSYTDKGAKAGTSYAYTVKAIYKDKNNKEYTSGFFYPETLTLYHGAPALKISARDSSVLLQWSLDSKAVGYRIYRKTANGSYEILANLSASSQSGKLGEYKDTEVSSGTKYTYAVRAYYDSTVSLSKAKVDTSNNWSGNKTVQITYLAVPKMKTSNENTKTGLKIGWTKVSGASAYEVYRKTTSDGKTWSSWVKVATINNGSTEVYVDTKVADGARYKYTVRAVASSGSQSYYNTSGIYAVRLPSVEVVSVKLDQNKGTTVTWKKVTNATGYQVWRKKQGGAWEKLTTITSGSTVSYLDTTIKSRKVRYYYTVKAFNTSTVDGVKTTTYGTYDSTGVSFGIAMSGSGWVKNNGNTYYVKDGLCLTGWQYLSRNGGTYKYYFDKDTGALVTNLYSYFGKSYRNLKCRIIIAINKDDKNPSFVTIYLYDSTKDSYCIPAVSVRCVGNKTKTTYANSSNVAFLGKGTGQRWYGGMLQYASYISGTYSWFHSVYFSGSSPYRFNWSSYNSLIDNNNYTGGCVRMQCIYAFLIQDIMKHGYGSTTWVPVVIQKNTSNPGPFGVPKIDKVSSRNTEPTDPAVTGKFFYDTSLWGISAKSGAQAWTYY